MIIRDKRKYNIDVDSEEMSGDVEMEDVHLAFSMRAKNVVLQKAEIHNDGYGTLFLILHACGNGESLSESGIEIRIPSGECARISHLFKQVIREIPLEENWHERLS